MVIVTSRKLRNIIFILMVFFVWMLPGYASETASDVTMQAVKKENRLGKRFGVFVRGVVNIVTLPLEIPRTFFEEKKRNPENWEWSFIPRTLENVVGRGLSAVNDSVFLTFMKNSDELDRPWSRQWDLPDYAWRKKTYQNDVLTTERDDRYTMIGVRG